MKKYEPTLVAYIVCLVVLFIFWLVLPSTALKDGDYIVYYGGYRRVFHYLIYYFLIKLFLHRLGFFIYSENSTMIGAVVIIVLELVFRGLAYIRSGHTVTIWWILGLVTVLLSLGIYGLDRVLYSINFEEVDKITE